MRTALLATIATLALTLVPGASATVGPSRTVAQGYAHRTFVNDPDLGHRDFKLAGPGRFATASDGSSLAAFGIVLADSGDGSGQAVLLFRNGRFLGWASAYESVSLAVSSTGDAIKVRYGNYKRSDPQCCPSSFKSVVYRWTGGRIVASGNPPLDFGAPGLRLHLG
jgi:hypothetical protein